MASRSKVRGIDEELWFGSYSDAEAEKKAAESVAATVGRVVGTKPFPIAAQRLAEATRDPDCSLVQVVRILERDMALSARVLRLVNSASFALRTPCTSVRHAASLVGTQKLNQLATTAAILDLVDHTSVHASRILEHSAVVGGLCRYLGVHLGLPADELFTCGFLHDIGKLMLLEVEGKRYTQLLQDVGDEYDAIHLYERELFGFDHALLAGHVLSRWSIPDPVPKVVAWHHHVTRAYEEGPRWASLCSVLRLADLLSYALAADDDEAQVERAARSESASYLDISAAQLAAIWDELRSLHERSRALFRGEEPPQALPPISLRPQPRALRPSASKGLRPSHPSLRPPSLKGLSASMNAPAQRTAVRGIAAPTNVTIKEAPEGPKQFPCVVCNGPSFANVCPACHGYVCPDHQQGPDEWCELCRKEYITETRGVRLRPVLILMLCAGLGATAVGACVNAATGRGFGSVGMLVGPLIGTGIAAGLVAIFHRYARRAWFLRTRPDRSTTRAARVTTPLVPAHPGQLVAAEVASVPPDAELPAAPPATVVFVAAGEAQTVVALPSSSERAVSVAPVVGVRASLAAPLPSEPPAVLAAASHRAPPADAPPPASRRSSNSIPARTSTEIGLSPPPGAAEFAASLAERAASVAPLPSVSPVASVAPVASVPPGADLDDESPREAAERGRTLRLLSAHSQSSPAAEPSSSSVVNAQAHPVPQVVVVSHTPSSPQISVRPIPSEAARPLLFPDWSDPPPARTSAAPRGPSVVPVPEPEPQPVEREPESGPGVAAAPDSDVPERTEVRSSVTSKAPSPPSVRPAPERTWQSVLQATGTADGW